LSFELVALSFVPCPSATADSDHDLSTAYKVLSTKSSKY